MNLKPAKLAAALVPFALTGAIMVSSAAAAPVPAASPVAQPQNVTQGFDIHNASGERLVLAGASSDDNGGNEGPQVGSVLAPGGIEHWEIAYSPLDNNNEVADYIVENNGGVRLGTLRVTMQVDSLNRPSASCNTSGGSPLVCMVGGNDITVADAG